MPKQYTCEARALPAWKRWAIRVVVWAAIVTPMILWPRVVGGIIAAVLLLAVLLWYGLKWKLRKIVRSLEVAQQRLLDLPETISPRPAHGAKWRDIRGVTQNRQALAALGFTSIGTYRVDELGGAQMEVMVAPDSRGFGLLHDNDCGCYVEFLALLDDGGYLSFANGGDEQMGDCFSRRAIRSFPEAGLAELYERFATYAPFRSRMELSPDVFGENYTRLYVEKRARCASDGVLDGEDASIRQAFLEQCNWSAAHWEARRDYVFFVHDRMDPEEVATRYLNLQGGVEEDFDEALGELVARIGSKPPREAFVELLADGAISIESVITVAGTPAADAYFDRRAKAGE